MNRPAEGALGGPPERGETAGAPPRVERLGSPADPREDPPRGDAPPETAPAGGTPADAAGETVPRELDPSDLEDQRLVSRFLAGDPKGFEDLYRKYRERVFAVLCRTLGDRDDALEGTQEVFIRVHQALGRYDPRARFFTWVYRIAMNHAIDKIRRRKVRREQMYDETFTEARGDQPTQRFERAGVALEAAEVRERVAAAVARLSEKHKSVFVLFSYEGLGYAQIAEALDIPVGTVMSRLYHARRKVREHLPPDWDPGGPERTREKRREENIDEP